MDALPIEVLGHVLSYLSVPDRCSAVLVSRIWHVAGCRLYNLRDVKSVFDARCVAKNRARSLTDVLEIIATNCRVVNVALNAFPIGNQPTQIVRREAATRENNLNSNKDENKGGRRNDEGGRGSDGIIVTEGTSPLGCLSSSSSSEERDSKTGDENKNDSQIIIDGPASCPEIDGLSKRRDSDLDVDYKYRTDISKTNSSPNPSKLCALSSLRSLAISNSCSDGRLTFGGKDLALMLRHCSQLRRLELHLCDGVFDSGVRTGVGLEALNDPGEPCGCRLKHRGHDLAHLVGAKDSPVFCDENSASGYTCGKMEAAFPSLEHLTISISACCGDRHLDVLLRHAPKLRGLSIEGTKLRRDDDEPDQGKMTLSRVIDWVAVKSKFLTSLHLYQCVDNEDAKKLASLQELKLNRVGLTFCERLTDKGVIQLVTCQPDILVLNLAGCGNLTDFALAAIKRHLKNLVDLNMDYTKVTGGPVANFYPPGVAISAAHAPKLRALSLMCCDVSKMTLWLRSLKRSLVRINLSSCPVEDEWFALLPKWVPRLRKLQLNNTYISTKGAKAIFENLHDLQELELARCKLINDEALLGDPEHLKGATEDAEKASSLLLERSSNSWPRVGPKDMAEYHKEKIDGSMTSLTKLQRLDISECNQLTDQSLVRLLRFDELKYLGLRGLDKIKVDTWDAAWAGCPSLRQIDSPWTKREENYRVEFANR